MASRTRAFGAINNQVNNQENGKNVKTMNSVIGPSRRAALGEIGNKVVTHRTNDLTGKSDQALKDSKNLITKRAVCKVEKVEKIEKVVPTKPLQVNAVRQTQKTEVKVDKLLSNEIKTEKISTANEKKNVAASLVKEKEIISSDAAAVEDIDEEDRHNPMLLSIYSNDIYDYYRKLEKEFPIKRQYLQGHEVSPRMRSVLVDWLIEVHEHFPLVQETLFLTVAIIDRFLQTYKFIGRKNLQLVGITAMFIASKYEETCSPDISDFVYIADNAYTKHEILQMELLVIKTLNFSFGRPLPLHFLRRYSKAGKVMPIHHTMAKYFMEQCLVDYNVCHHNPSLIAAAALYLSIRLIGNESCEEGEVIWTDTLVHYSTYTLLELLPVVSEMASIIINSENSKFQAVRRKYSKPKHMSVSLRPELKSPTLVKLSMPDYK